MERGLFLIIDTIQPVEVNGTAKSLWQYDSRYDTFCVITTYYKVENTVKGNF